MSGLTVFRESGAHAPPRSGRRQVRTLRVVICMMAVPNERCLTVLLTPAEDQFAQCRITVSDTFGWDVRLDIDGRTVALMHCAEWHRVERLCSTLASIWTASHTELPASR